jgi:hypothetical protein
LLCTAGWALPADDNADVTGYWEGDSKCTVPNSACRDEHALYRIFTDDKNSLKVNGCKVVEGKPQFMGTLTCEYQPAVLTCTAHTASQDEWEFHVARDNMSGTLKIGSEKTLYRRINVHRSDTKLTCP